MYCNHSSNRRGRYEISAKIGGLGINVYTDDAEIYDYFRKDYHDADDPDWARRSAFDMLMEEACKRFIGALVTYNGDPFLVENDELALDVIKAIDKHHAIVDPELTPDDDEYFTDSCERLDLDPVANDVKRIMYYPTKGNVPSMYICLPEDWEIA